MSPSELENLFINNPTQAYRLVLSSGDRVIVADPRKAVVSQLLLALRRTDDDESPYGKLTFVSIPNIAMVEPIEPPQLPGRSRRRR